MKNFGKTTDIRDIITVGYEADNAVLYSTSQSLTNDQKIQARANIGAGTSNFDGDYKSLANKPTIPTKTSQLDNDSNFATTSQVEAKYTKPSGGIPKTDLATAVQNSLTAADNAVKYTSQSLTDAQKKQARTNIGAGTSNFSGNYKDLADKPPIPPEVSIVQSTGESTSSVMSQKATTNAVNGRLSKTDNTNIEVLGTKKATTTLGGNQLYAPNGVIFGGTAAAAGLVTSGICGVTTPSDGGACSKENLYINYDGNNDFNAGRQVVLNAGTVGNHLGSNMYQYTVPRGEIVKNWVEAKGYATSVKVNGNTIASSGGVVDIGTVLTDASKFATSAQGTKADNAMPKKGGTFTGEVKFGSTENFQGYYIKRMIGSLGAGTSYANLDSSYKDGTYHRMWRLRFPSGSSFWGKIKITLYGGYSSFNASGVMSKSITCNFNTSSIYNNVGCYDGLGVNVEQDFRISEAIWNATASAWEVLIWQKNLNGNNSPTIMLECWTTNNTNYINAFNGIAAQTVELTQSTSYSAQKASSTGGTKTVEWATLPVYENPLGEEIATVAMLKDKQDKITSSNKLSSSLVDGLGAAAAKAVDTAITANSTSTNLPTSKAVEDRINAHSGIDKVGTITGINMNGASKGTSGVVDLGTVITAHQDISGKANLSGGNTFSGNQVITGALYPEQNAGATFGNETHRWNNAYIQNSIHLYTGSSGTPNIDVTHTGLTDGTNPTSNIYSGLNFEEKDGKNLSEFRNQVTSAGRISTDLWTRSFGTDYGNYVGLFAAPNAGASNSTDVWHFSPNLDAIIDLGQSNLRWRNVRAVTTYSNVYGSDLCSTNSLRLKDPNITRGTNQAASGGKQNYYRAININDKNNHKGVAVEWGYLCEKNSNGNTTKHVSELNLLVYPPNTTDNANFVKVALGKRSDGTTYFTYAGNQVVTTQNFSLSGTTLTITL